MATAKIDIVGPDDIPLIAGIYSRMFRPQHDAEFFRRRFQGRHNPLMLVASLDKTPVGFFCGFELKPSTYFAWLYGVDAEFRRQGIASQIMDAMHEWVRTNEYDTIRFECHNQHRPMLHLAIAQGYDVVGIRWDSDRGNNLVIFEKTLGE